MKVFLFICVMIFSIDYFVCGRRATNVSPRDCLVYGPGLDPKFEVPARYFFIQAVDRNHENLTDSCDEFKVEIHGTSELCRVWSQVLDRHDGSYIVRFKLYESCISGVKINITFKNFSVAQSPYILKGPIYDEECDCPNVEKSSWKSAVGCPSSISQLTDDLRHFPTVDMDEVVRESVQRFRHAGSHSLCHYVVKDNKVYRKCQGDHVDFNMFMDNILLSLSRKMYLPDVELLVNLGDWPLETRKLHEKPLPIFSWCGSNMTLDIVMPTYDITQSTLDTMGRVMLDMLSVQGNTGPTWNEKIELGFWRGRDSRRERLNLVKLGRENPHLINASLTNFFFFHDEMDSYGPTVEHISFFDFFKFKYQINIDGTVAAYRFPYLLAGDSVVLKQESPYYEHFYGELQPWKHYIPFKRDLSDLTEKLEWVKYNDEMAKKIARDGRKFAQDHLMASNVLCYYVMLLEEFSKRLINPVYVRENMELVTYEYDTRRRPCKCLRDKKLKDEL